MNEVITEIIIIVISLWPIYIMVIAFIATIMMENERQRHEQNGNNNHGR